MQDTMLMIYQSLKKSAAVTKKIAAIYNNPRAPDKDKNLFPRITMFEMLNNDSEYADDSAIMNTVIARLDIWSKQNNLFELSKAVKETLETDSLMCRVELQNDMYESDTNIYHKPINVTLKMEV